MKTKILISIILVIFFICTVSATDIKDMNFNVSSELQPQDDAVGLGFLDENNIVLRILDKNLDDQNSGFTKYNKTVYSYNDSMAVGDEQLLMFTYGEYIKIDGKKYWVDVTYYGAEPNYDKCLEYLEYFNEHNNFEPVEV